MRVKYVMKKVRDSDGEFLGYSHHLIVGRDTLQLDGYTIVGSKAHADARKNFKRLERVVKDLSK